jgi:hypothetical protein
MRCTKNSNWFWMDSSFLDQSKIPRNHSSSSSKTLLDPISQQTAAKSEKKRTNQIGSNRGGVEEQPDERTWCRSWCRGRRRAAWCRRAPRRGCRCRWRMRRRWPRRSTPTPCPAGTASRGLLTSGAPRAVAGLASCTGTKRERRRQASGLCGRCACGSADAGKPTFYIGHAPSPRIECPSRSGTGSRGAQSSVREQSCLRINLCPHAASGMTTFLRRHLARLYPRNRDAQGYK